MGNVNDSAIIAQVFEALGDNPALTRRAAIIEIAGEGSLRRIERKMATQQNADPHAIDTARRAKVHAQYAIRYPVAALEDGNFYGFSAHLPRAGKQPLTVFLGLKGQRLLASFDEAIRGYNECDAATIDVRMASRAHPSEIISALAWYGLLKIEDWAFSDLPGGLVTRTLANTLATEWRALGLGSHLDENTLRLEAAEVEGQRLSKAGLDRLLQRFPDDYRDTMSAYGSYALTDEGRYSCFEAMSRWVMQTPENASLMRDLGALSGLIDTKVLGSNESERTGTQEFVFRNIRRSDSISNAPVTPNDAAWLLSVFGPGCGIATLSSWEINLSLMERDFLEPVLAKSGECLPYVKISRALDKRPSGNPGMLRWIEIASILPTHLRSFQNALANFEKVATQRGMTLDQVIGVTLEESYDLIAPTWCLIVDEVIARYGVTQAARDPWLHDEWYATKEEFERCAFEFLSGGKEWKGFSEAAISWQNAGRPGFTAAGERGFRGSITRSALYTHLTSAEPTLMTREERLAFLDFLIGLFGEAECQSLMERIVERFSCTFQRPSGQNQVEEDKESLRSLNSAESAGEPRFRRTGPWWKRSLSLPAFFKLRKAA